MTEGTISATAGRDEFLQLLVTQLRHQDPLDPLKQHDFLAQLAQFSTLEGIEELNANFSDMLRLQELTQGASLLGNRVHYATDSGVTVEGTVESVRVENDSLIVGVDGQDVPIHQIHQLLAPLNTGT